MKLSKRELIEAIGHEVEAQCVKRREEILTEQEKLEKECGEYLLKNLSRLKGETSVGYYSAAPTVSIEFDENSKISRPMRAKLRKLRKLENEKWAMRHNGSLRSRLISDALIKASVAEDFIIELASSVVKELSKDG